MKFSNTWKTAAAGLASMTLILISPEVIALPMCTGNSVNVIYSFTIGAGQTTNTMNPAKGIYVSASKGLCRFPGTVGQNQIPQLCNYACPNPPPSAGWVQNPSTGNFECKSSVKVRQSDGGYGTAATGTYYFFEYKDSPPNFMITPADIQTLQQFPSCGGTSGNSVPNCVAGDPLYDGVLGDLYANPNHRGVPNPFTFKSATSGPTNQPIAGAVDGTLEFTVEFGAGVPVDPNRKAFIPAQVTDGGGQSCINMSTLFPVTILP